MSRSWTNKGRGKDIIFFQGGRTLSQEAAQKFKGGATSLVSLDKALQMFADPAPEIEERGIHL